MENTVIESLGIYELRTLARKVGVQSPTTKKRDELIELINQQISSGDSTENINKKGRPPKNISSTDDFFNKLVCQTEKREFPTQLIFRDSGSDRRIECEACGVVELKDDKFIIKNKDGYKIFDIVELSEEFVRKNNIAVGDYVELQAYGQDDSSYGYANNIYSINYGLINKDINIDDISINEDVHIINNINRGERVLIKCDNNIRSIFEQNKQTLCKIEQTYKIVIIANNVIPEEYVALTRENNFVKFITRFDDEIKEQEENLKRAILHIRQLLKYGENVFVVCYNLDDIITNINLCFQLRLASEYA